MKRNALKRHNISTNGSDSKKSGKIASTEYYVLFLGLRSESSRSDQCFMFRDIFHGEGGD